MFIKANDKELLPHWARFVKGVINTPDLSPTISRDALVRDQAYEDLRDLLGQIILDHLDDLAQNNPETLEQVVGMYNHTIKAYGLKDDAFFDRICDLGRVNTDSGSISMQAYLQKSGGIIYYFAERGMATQHKLLFSQKSLPVIDGSWGVEEEFLDKYATRKGMKLERLEAGSETIFKPQETIDDNWQDLERQFKRLLNKDAKAVAFDPSAVPALLVAKPPEQGEKDFGGGAGLNFSSAQIRQMFGKIEQSKHKRTSGEDTILKLNTTNPLMQQLRDMHRNETFHLALTAIYHNAMMFAQHYVSPQNAEIIFETNNAAISAMIGNSRALEEMQAANARMQIELDELKRRQPQVALSPHRACFFAFDYHIEENFALMRRIQKYFHDRDFGIELVAPVNEMEHLNILRDLDRQLNTVHFGMAEITGNNFNVLYEAGYLRGNGKPLILLRQEGTLDDVPFDIASEYRIEYKLDKRYGEIEFFWLEKELDKTIPIVFKMSPDLQQAEKWTG